MTRCASLLAAALLAAAFPVWSQPAAALRAEDLRVFASAPGPAPEGQMLSSYLLSQVDAVTAKRQARRDAIHSAADFQAWQEQNRRAFLASIGGLPAAKTPLNARVMGELRRDGYVVRKVIFESQPELYVTANLYVPTTGKGPFPAVLVANGHSANGKAYANYQHVYIGLVRQGYVVLSWDNIGQGERLQLWDYTSNRSRGRESGNEHGMIGIPEPAGAEHGARADLGRDPGARLPRELAGGGRRAHRHDGQFGRRHTDDLRVDARRTREGGLHRHLYHVLPQEDRGARRR
jgi:hypothetical protein